MTQTAEELKREILLIDQSLERNYESMVVLKRHKKILEAELRKLEG